MRGKRYRTAEVHARVVTTQVAAQMHMDPGILELWCSKVYQTLERLLTDAHGPRENAIYWRAHHYDAVVMSLLRHPGINQLLSKNDQAVLADGLADIIEQANKLLDTSVSPMDINLFCSLSEIGREHFLVNELDPQDFMEDEILELALMIHDNYPAYEETLRGLQL